MKNVLFEATIILLIGLSFTYLVLSPKTLQTMANYLDDTEQK
jgi:Sec-independent protein secretion pathway component TatC